MLNWIVALLDRIFAVIGAGLFAQAPLFMQQYTQQLIGRTEELQMQVDAMRRGASVTGKTLDQLIQKFLDSGDSDFVRQGQLMDEIVTRWHDFTTALSAMDASGVWSRPFTFLSHFNTEVFKSTLKHFTFGFPLTVEGALYAFVGLCVGFFTFSFCKQLCRWISR